MSHLIDILLVSAALLGAILYAVFALGPRTWRQRVSSALASIGLSRFAPKVSGACGGCDTCAAPDAPGSVPGAETRVALKDIGRRQA